MILSRKFVSDYIDLDESLSIKQIGEDMTRVGNEYDFCGKLVNASNLVIGEIIECVNHPDSDHMHLCKVNIGDSVLDIVCGALNARKGIKVIVALVGAVLPNVTIKKSVIRGCESNGMLCALNELGIDTKYFPSNIENGIYELGSDAVVGENPIKYLGLDDEIIDFELTPNRGDLLSILGMAYELGAIYDKKVKDIDLSYDVVSDNINDSFGIEVQSDNCKLFLARKCINVVVGESPDFIKNRLIACGIRPINNVVDISNYVMLETGQPLHFYDAAKVGDMLIVREASEGESIVTLDNNSCDLDSNDIVIANCEEILGVAGVMGGISSEVTSSTTSVIIESAIFDSIMVRKTSKKFVRSEASNRFEKGLDPKRTYMAMERTCHLLQKYASASIMDGMCSFDEFDKSNKVIDITVNNINKVLGTNIETDDIIKIFSLLGFESSVSNNTIKVIVPTRRLDISIKEDLIEEVGRIYGINNIKGKLPLLNIKQGSYDKNTRIIRNKLVDLGLNEVLTQIFLNEDDAKRYCNKENDIVKLMDPLSIEKNSLRCSLIPSLLKVYEYNKNRNYKDICIFEMAKSFYKKDDKFYENNELCVLMSGEYYLELGNKKNVDFYIIKGILCELLSFLGYDNRYSLKIDSVFDYLHPGISASINLNGKNVGVIGKLHPLVTNDSVFVFSINLDELFKNRVSKLKYKEFSKFPYIKKDVAFIVPCNISASDISSVIKKSGGKMLTNIEVFDVYTGVNVQEGFKSIAYSLTFECMDRTLSDSEVMDVFNNIISTVLSKFDCELRNK